MFPLPAFLLSPTTLLGALCAFLAAIAASFFFLYRHEVSNYADFRANVEQAQKQAAADAALRVRRAEKITNDTVAGWSAAVAHLKRNPRVVRVHTASSGGGVSSVPNPADIVDAGAGWLVARPDLRTATDPCADVEQDAVEAAAQLEWLKYWVKQQSEIKP